MLFRSIALAASSILSQIAELNISALEGDRALDEIFWAIPIEGRTNTGAVKQSYFRKYDFIHKHGGLAFFGVDPLSGTRLDCVSFKPTKPESPDRKYITPPKSKAQAFYPAVTYHVWKLVSDRYKVPMPEGMSFATPHDEARGFWAWVLENEEIPIFFTEGCKKALSFMSAGFPTVGVAGINSGYIAIKDEEGKTLEHELIPSLRYIRGGDRTVYIAFDRDSSANTIAAVITARSTLAKLLIEAGNECYSLVWNGDNYKGVDDLIARAGIKAVEKSIASAERLTGEKPNFKKKVVANMLGEKIAKEWRGHICFDETAKVWRIYNAGVWDSKYDSEMERRFYSRIVQDVPAIEQYSYITNILRFTKGNLTVDSWDEVSSLEYLPFNNGVWSFQDKVLLPHSPNFRLTWKLPRDYCAISTNWSAIDKFLMTITSGNKSLKELLIASCAAVLQGRADLHKALYLFGDGGNGKGAFMHLLEMLVGTENSYSTTLDSICDNKFDLANMYGKRLTLCADEDKRVKGFGNFKKAVGGDTLRGEEKGKRSFNYVYQGLVVLASNDPVFVGDNSYGISRRLIPIPFVYQVPDKEAKNLDPVFKSDINAFTTYLLNLDREWVTKTLRESNQISAIKDLMWDLEIRTNSIAAFCDEQLIIDPTASTLSADLFTKYEAYCAKTGFSPKHQNNFCPGLVNLCKNKLKHQVESAKSRDGKVIAGLRLRTQLDADCDGCDGLISNKFFVDPSVTTVTAEKEFSLPINPQPPKIDRPVPQRVEISDYFHYQITGDQVDWLELAFENQHTANKWDKCLSITLGAQTLQPHAITRNGKKWILVVKGVTLAQVKELQKMNLDRSPEQVPR